MNKMIWVIVIDEVIDFVNYPTMPYAYHKEEDARKAFAELKADAMKEYAEELEEDDWEVDDKTNYFEMYSEEYCKDHYRIDLYQINVE